MAENTQKTEIIDTLHLQKSKSKFVHLHVHSEYSLLDGAVRISSTTLDDKTHKKVTYSPLVDALKARDMDAIAITDHGNMYGVFKFVTTLFPDITKCNKTDNYLHHQYEKCKAEGTEFVNDMIKPIIGEEFYVAEDMNIKTVESSQRYHLVLLAKNLVGYKNLMKLTSKAFVDGFYNRPRIDLDLLSQHSEGLICLSACIAGRIPKLLLSNQYEKACEYAIKMRDMFAPGDFYIELQNHGIEEELRLLQPLVKLARDIGVKVVATNDVHYIEQEDADIQDTMMCINYGCSKNDTSKMRFANDSFYLKSADEMIELFDWCPEAIESTIEIADKIDGTFFVAYSKEKFIPKFDYDDLDGSKTRKFIHDLTYERLGGRYPVITDEIRARVDYELGVIDKCGFNDYFLIVWDFCNHARQSGIPVGPGRGSGVGSLVAYSIGITDVDPLKYNLLFERFLSAERISMPDFDIDFCFVRRPEIIKYVTGKYGKENVSQIISYSTMSAKQVVKDVARVYEVPYAEAAGWIKDIPTGKVLIKEVLTPGTDSHSEDFENLYNNNATARKIIDISMKLEGMPRQTGMHAAGVLICKEPISNHVALSRSGMDITSQFDKKVVEKIGLLKMDFLGLKTLTDISRAIEYVRQDKNLEKQGRNIVDFYKLGYDDKKVYDLIASGDCMAVFQLESGGMKKFMSQLQPSCLEDVMAGISMYRPGPMQFLDKFLQNKRNPDGIVYIHPLLEDILSVTYGCIVYQEQVMQIARTVAGYSFGQADIMRRIMGEKNTEKLEKQRSIFVYGGYLEDDGNSAASKKICGAVSNGVDEDIAKVLFDQILEFAKYAFNKSHAAAYSVVSYQTAYLKCYHPVHYLTSVINNRIDNADETKKYINYVKEKGIKVLPPDINRSDKWFSIDNESIRFGLKGVKSVGETAVDFILSERQNGEFTSFQDFIERCTGQINKRLVESLILSGAFDQFGKSRATLVASYEHIMDAMASIRKKRDENQISFFTMDDDNSIKDVEIKFNEIAEYDKQTLLKFEKDMLGMYFSGHPLEEYPDLREFNFNTSMLYTNDFVDEDGNAETIVDVSMANKRVVFGAIFNSKETRVTKKQEKFLIGVVEDKMGTIQYAIYPRVYQRVSALLLEDAPFKIFGKIDMRDENEPKLTIENVEKWVVEQKEAEREGVLYIRIKNNSEKVNAFSILSMHSGSCKCYAQIEKPTGAELVDTKFRVDPNAKLISSLEMALGKKCVLFKKSN